MASEQKFYWLKLKRDFFKRHDIQIIEDMPNGKEYILFYLKLLCESVDHDGNLRFSEQIPYNEQMLSTITRTNVDIVRAAIKCFTELNMMEILDDGTIYMREVHKMLGGETAWAEKKRAYRENLKKGQTEDIVLPLSDKSKSIEKEKEIKKETTVVVSKESSQPDDLENLIRGLMKKHCPSIPSDFRWTKERQEAARKINESMEGLVILVDGWSQAFQKAEKSTFLHGNNRKGWKADIDWILQEDHFWGLIEGKYDDYKPPKPDGTFETEDFFAEAVRRSYEQEG